MTASTRMHAPYCCWPPPPLPQTKHHENTVYRTARSNDTTVPDNVYKFTPAVPEYGQVEQDFILYPQYSNGSTFIYPVGVSVALGCQCRAKFPCVANMWRWETVLDVVVNLSSLQNS